ncbi:hypothetical protein OROMI_003718 [Orobanche minor]
MGGIVSAMTINKGIIFGFVPSDDSQLGSGEISGRRSPIGEQQQYSRGIDGKRFETETDRSSSSSRGLWSFFVC